MDRVELRRVMPSTGESASLDPPIFFGAADVFGLFDMTADGSIIAHLSGTKRGNIWVAELGEGAQCPVSIAHIPGSADPHRIPDNQCAFNKVVGRQRDLFLKDLDAQA